MNDFGSKIPFFILGTGRCGSTYLGKLFSVHEGVSLTDEYGVVNLASFFSRYASTAVTGTCELHLRESHQLEGLLHQDCTDAVSKIVNRHAIQMIEEFYTEHFAERDFTHWGEKLPDPHAVISIREVWPQTKSIVLVRDPRDVAASWRAYSQLSHVYSYAPHFADNYSVEHWALMWQHMYQSFPVYLPEALELRYEDLVAEPVVHIKAAFDFLGLELRDHHIAKMMENKTFKMHGTSKSIEESMQRWRRDLNKEEIAVVESICGEQMERFGYAFSEA